MWQEHEQASLLADCLTHLTDGNFIIRMLFLSSLLAWICRPMFVIIAYVFLISIATAIWQCLLNGCIMLCHLLVSIFGFVNIRVSRMFYVFLIL